MTFPQNKREKKPQYIMSFYSNIQGVFLSETQNWKSPFFHWLSRETWSSGLLISSFRNFMDFPVAAHFINRLFGRAPPLASPHMSAFSLKEEAWKFINKPSIKFHNRCDLAVLKLNTFNGSYLKRRGREGDLLPSKIEVFIMHLMLPFHLLDYEFCFSFCKHVATKTYVVFTV